MANSTDQHDFYLYNEEHHVYARAFKLPRVLVKSFAPNGDHGLDVDELPITANQAAYNFVQSVINPEDVDATRKYGKMGFLSQKFLELVSPRCEAVVRAAYEAAGQKLDS